jgi:hypothetical protein
MDRALDLECFYSILEELKSKTGFRKLLECHGKMDWPRRGVYFFFEPGETRAGSDSLRVVRVGTHGLKQGSKATLWQRLRQHRGTIKGKAAGGGNHRCSIFRLHVGTAIMNRQGIDIPTWGRGSSASQSIRQGEIRLECLVSQTIGNMPLLFLEVDDPTGPDSLRGYIERNAIGLLSNYQRLPIDKPSLQWLGKYCAHPYVQNSGLWNLDHVTASYDPAFLRVLKRLVDKM